MWLHATLTDDLMQLLFFNLGINYGFQASEFAITYDIVLLDGEIWTTHRGVNPGGLFVRRGGV
jgi:hypothetical protein